MKKAEIGDFVKVHYTIKRQDGKIVGASEQGKPLGFILGRGKVLKKLEQGVIGMRINETRTVKLTPEEGYGLRKPSMVIKIRKEDLPTQQHIAVGRTLQYMDESGTMINFIIADMDADTVILDANHPLAGQHLTYHVVLISAEKPL